MPIILSQHLDGSSSYDDHIGYLYHFSNKFFSTMKAGESFLYYCPAELETGQYYFGCGQIGDVLPDPHQEDRYYCEINDYVEFPIPVPVKTTEGLYLENLSLVKPFFRRGVRHIDPMCYQLILGKSGLETELFAGETPPVAEGKILSPLERMENINRIYATASPRQQRRISEHIEKGTYLGRKLAELNHYSCQICHQRGFIQKTGRSYVEAHHFQALHQLDPKSCCSDNVIIVCSECHRKIHYANTLVDVINPDQLAITINQTEYIIQRNNINILLTLEPLPPETE